MDSDKIIKGIREQGFAPLSDNQLIMRSLAILLPSNDYYDLALKKELSLRSKMKTKEEI